MKRLVSGFLVIILVVLVSQQITATHHNVYRDPMGQYKLSIPEQWRFQPSKSSDSLSVFFGPDKYDVLYIERIGRITKDLAGFVEEVIEAYQSPHGLAHFELLTSPQEITVDQDFALYFHYEFAGDFTQLEEERILVSRDDIIYSITRSFAADDSSGARTLRQLIASWRWF